MTNIEAIAQDRQHAEFLARNISQDPRHELAPLAGQYLHLLDASRNWRAANGQPKAHPLTDIAEQARAEQLATKVAADGHRDFQALGREYLRLLEGTGQ